MDPGWILFDCAVVLAFMLEGAWLASIGQKRDLFDHLLTPFPLGAAALVFVFLERHGL